MLITTILISAIYFSLIALFIKGWNQIPTFHFSADRPTKTGISVVVACRNEAKNFPTFLAALKNQSLKSFQLILIDDNSTDSTFEIMKQAEKEFGNILVLKSENYGKKQALKLGIENAKNDLIVTTDADCSPTPHWLEAIIQFQQQTKSDLIIGPVAIQPAHTLFEKMQQLEFLSLVSSGAGAAGIGQAIMCNGANLVFHKQTWLDNFLKLQTKSNTGDDIFLLHALKKQNGNINFLKSKQAIVSTKACETRQSFIEQRQRWTSKAPLYSDFATIVVAIIVFVVSLLQLVLLFGSFVKSEFLLHFAILTVSKLVIDSFFLLQTASFFGQKITAKTFFTLAVAYPFYIVYSAISGIFKGFSDIRKGLFR
jgi:cellulose synthase/poly-beta-1,6-N-acetylglucosamine synthase-like glycosyltransferase